MEGSAPPNTAKRPRGRPPGTNKAFLAARAQSDPSAPLHSPAEAVLCSSASIPAAAPQVLALSSNKAGKQVAKTKQEQVVVDCAFNVWGVCYLVCQVVYASQNRIKFGVPRSLPAPQSDKAEQDNLQAIMLYLADLCGEMYDLVHVSGSGGAANEWALLDGSAYKMDQVGVAKYNYASGGGGWLAQSGGFMVSESACPVKEDEAWNLHFSDKNGQLVPLRNPKTQVYQISFPYFSQDLMDQDTQDLQIAWQKQVRCAEDRCLMQLTDLMGYRGLTSLLFEVCHYGTGFILSRYFLEQLVDLAGHWGCKLVCDEIMTAGRTPKHFLASHGHMGALCLTTLHLASFTLLAWS